jgi:type IX secretion system PorP/SprF family membrane protein
MKNIFTLFGIVISHIALAQDYHWSTNHFNRALINPAENAIDTGLDASVAYRNQWMSVMNPFSTLGININSSLPKGFGVGLTAVDDKAGSAGWHRTNVLLNINYGFNLRKTKLRIGAGFGIDQYQYNWQNAIFPDQINPDLTLRNTAESFPTFTRSNFDNTCGLYAEIPLYNKILNVGLNYNHFLSAKNASILNTGETYSNLFSSYASLPLYINPNWSAKPYISYLNQGSFNQIFMGSSFHYNLQENEFFTSLNYRLNDALIGQVGMIYNTMRLGISYDYTMSSIRANAGGTGAVELFAGYHFRKKKVEEIISKKEKEREIEIDTLPVQISYLVQDKNGEFIDSFRVYILNSKTEVSMTTVMAKNMSTTTLKHCEEYTAVISKKGYLSETRIIQTGCNPSVGMKLLDTVKLEALEVNKNYALNNIYYAYDKTELTEESKRELDKLLEILSNNPSIVIELSSHTDNKGTEQYNQELSENRAKSCVNYLIEKGINATRLIPKGYGETMPIAPNENEDGSDNEAGRAKNRRTEFRVISL